MAVVHTVLLQLGEQEVAKAIRAQHAHERGVALEACEADGDVGRRATGVAVVQAGVGWVLQQVDQRFAEGKKGLHAPTCWRRSDSMTSKQAPMVW